MLTRYRRKFAAAQAARLRAHAAQSIAPSTEPTTTTTPRRGRCILDPADPCGTCPNCLGLCCVCGEAPGTVPDEHGNRACEDCADAVGELARSEREWRP